MLEADQTTNRKLFRTMARGKKQTLQAISQITRRSFVLRLRFGVLRKSPPANACDDVKKRMRRKEFCSRLPTFGNRRQRLRNHLCRQDT